MNEASKKISYAVSQFENTGILNIFEPNNEDLNRQVVSLKRDMGIVYVKYGYDGLMLRPSSDWKICKSSQQIIEQYVEWLWLPKRRVCKSNLV